MPSALRRRASSATRRNACRYGSMLSSCEPICTAMPSIDRPGSPAASRNRAGASAQSTPNLSVFRPVLIWSSVPASTSGLIRTATEAVRPRRSAMRERLRDLGSALDIDLEDAAPERSLHLGVGLADTGEDDPVRRDSGCERAPELAFRHDIRARAQPGQQPQHRQVPVRLHRIADARRGQHRLELAVSGFDGVGGIDIGRRADLSRDIRQPDRPGRQAAVDVVEGPHSAG